MRMRMLICRTLAAVLFFCILMPISCSKPSQAGPDTPDSLPHPPLSPVYEKAVLASPRRIPVAYDVDVVVVGGTSGAVAAAATAAQAGAKVFLAAQRPYLGADLCGTYRLWLGPDEIPQSALARAVFAEPEDARRLRNAVNFTYNADLPSAPIHKDTTPPSVLSDGKWSSASSQSVQYGGDVTVIADTGRVRQLEKVHVMAYQRRNPGAIDDFEVESVTVSTSDDARSWKSLTIINNDRAGESLNQPWGPIELSAPVGRRARYIRFVVKKSAAASRILLGEIIIEGQHSSGRTVRYSRTPPTPMHVKRTLDRALLDAGAEFLYGCYATDLLTDARGAAAGIVMVNRSGCQAVKAKVVIDATPRAALARIAGAGFEPYPSGPRSFRYVAVGGEVQKGPGLDSRLISPPLSVAGASGRQAVEYTVEIPMKDASYASFAFAEQIVRDKTWNNGQLDASETPFEVPPDPVRAKAVFDGPWPGAGKVDLNVFRPANIDRFYVLGGCAAVTRSAADKLLRPLEYMDIGARIGVAAARQASQTNAPEGAGLPSRSANLIVSGDVRENLDGLRNRQAKLGFVGAAATALPVLGEYDVVVVGGGTGGAPAGISAARQGAQTLVVEYLHGLGGVGTMGLISKYYYGYIKGFTAEVDQGVAEISSHGKNTNPAWNPEFKKEWYRRQLRKAGADIWFGAIGCGAFVQDGQVKGAVVATPHGCGVILAKVVIDATGNADIAITAGADYRYTGGDSVAIQGAGLPPRRLGTGYTNTDWTFIDDSDILDVWRAFVVAKDKYKDAYDLGQLLDTRERRRIVGDFTISPMDISLARTYPDTIVMARSNFDTHGFTIHPLFLIRPPDRKEMLVGVPYRSLLPKGLEGILVTGLGVSAHRDAMPVIRMQADIQNQGYAAGLIAATTAQTGLTLRDIDIKAIQKQLVDKGNLPDKVLTDGDSFPISLEKVYGAVKNVLDDFKDLDVILAQPKDSMSLVKRAYSDAEDPNARLTYAHILAMLGDPVGTDTLLDAVASAKWDKGWNFTGMGQFGMSLSPLDSLVIALGRTRDKRALQPLIEKAAQLDIDSEFSHCRAVAVAFETIADPAAAKPLAELLRKPGIMGHAFTDIEDAAGRTPANAEDTSTRNNSLRELFLARALYRCGDLDGLGEKILREYSHDLRAHYARHASAILEEKVASRAEP
ncbi:MAG: FAD-dependent oxidoreductase [Sedimentisphaerales bacterium]|nr:FAD-dependent oxidoreductase [Sedimentisphaerales bacterium]